MKYECKTIKYINADPKIMSELCKLYSMVDEMESENATLRAETAKTHTVFKGLMLQNQELEHEIQRYRSLLQQFDLDPDTKCTNCKHEDTEECYRRAGDIEIENCFERREGPKEDGADE